MWGDCSSPRLNCANRIGAKRDQAVTGGNAIESEQRLALFDFKFAEDVIRQRRRTLPSEVMLQAVLGLPTLSRAFFSALLSSYSDHIWDDPRSEPQLFKMCASC